MRLLRSPWSVGLLALVVRLSFFAANLDNPFYLLPILDEARYLDLARLGRHAGAAAWLYMDPLFPWLVSLFFRFTGQVLLLRVLHILLDSATAMVIAHAGRVYFNRRAGRLAGMLYAFYAPAVFFAPLMLKPVLLMHMVAWFFLLLRGRPRFRPRFGWGVFTGAFFLAITLLRANFLLLLPLSLLLVAWLRRRESLSWIAGVVVGFLICGVGFGVVTHRLTGRASLLPRAGGYVVYIANNEANPLGEHRVPDFVLANNPRAMDVYFRRQAEQLTGRPMDTVAASGYWRRRAFAYMTSQPGAWLKTASHRAGQWLSAYEFPSNYNFQLAAAAVRWLGWLPGWGMALSLGLTGLVLAGGKQRHHLYLALPAVVTIATFILFFSYGRLRLPAVPGLLLGAGFLLDQLWLKAARGFGRRAGTWLWLVPVAGLWLVAQFWPHQPVADRVERYNRALADLQLGRIPQVAAVVGVLLAEEPANAQYRFLAANLDLARHRYASAIAGYRSVLALDPQYPGAWHNKGRAHQGLQQWELARQSLATALAREPSGLTRLVLAQVYQRQGDSGRMAACLEAVIEDPTAPAGLRQEARLRRGASRAVATTCP